MEPACKATYRNWRTWIDFSRRLKRKRAGWILFLRMRESQSTRQGREVSRYFSTRSLRKSASQNGTSGQQRKTALDFRVFIGSRAPGRRTGTQLTVGLAYTPPGGQFVELLGGAIVNPFFEVRRRDTDGRCAITSHSETGYSHSQLRRSR